MSSSSILPLGGQAIRVALDLRLDAREAEALLLGFEGAYGPGTSSPDARVAVERAEAAS